MSESRPRRAARTRKVVVEEVEEEEEDEEEEEEEEAQISSEEEETPPPSPRKRKTPKKPAAEKPAQAAIRTRTNKRNSRALSEVQEVPAKTPVKAAAKGRPRKVRKTSLEAQPEAEETVEPPATATPAVQLQTPRLTPGDSNRSTPASGEKRKHSALNHETPRRSRSAEVEAFTPKIPLATSTPKVPLGTSSPRPDSIAVKEKSSTPGDDMLSQIHEVKPNATPRASQSTQKQSMSQQEISIRQRSYAMPQQAIEPEGPKQRMVISNLILVNFKSYAGVQEVGPFHVSFSSVVGPNGSGKSNVIDSLLFVFGFRASKMRQGKVSDLIHNSGTYKNLDHCEVQVHFKEIIDLPGGGFEDVPGSTLIVSRKAFKNNSSQYYINGKTSNHGTVTTLLREKGIDLDHKRFLILQGEVESIAQMKPKAQGENDDGLLEYLEDIVGTTKYKQPIEDAAKEAEELNEVCAQKLHRVTLVEKEKDGLEDKKNIALKYIKDENELAEKQSMLYQVYMHECNNIVNLTSENIAQMQLQLDEEMTKHRGNEDGMKALKKKYDAIIKEQEALEKDVTVLAKEMSKFDKENVKLQEKQKFLTQKQKKSEKVQQTSRLSASEATSQIEQCTHDIEKYGAEATALEERLVEEEKALAVIRDELKDKTAGFSEQIAAKQKSLEPFNERINQKQSAIAVAQSELDIINEKRNASAVALDEIKAKIVSIRDNGRAKETEFEEKKGELDQLEKDGAELEKRLNQLTNKEPEIRTAVSSARAKAEEARASLSASQNQGSVLSGLMRLKESGRIEGFHGRLGNLGTIDAKYDVAISTACPQLDNMVVDSVEIGQQCIEYLRKNNLGRAMFICLDRLPRRDLTEIDTPENVPRLFDLVKSSDAKFSPAFYSVLQNTLVAKDMAQANRIAYGAKRWRVVTLDGQLIDKSGTMTGGGTRVNRGGMSSKFAAQTTKENVVKLEAERDAQEKALSQYQQKRQDFETALRDVNNQIPRLRTEISKIELEIKSTLKNMEDAKLRRKEIEAETGPSKADDDQAKKLEKKIAGLEAGIEEIRSEMAGIEDEIKDLQDKVMQIGGIRLRGQKAKVDSIREQIDTLNQQINAAEVAKVKAEKNKIKFEKQFAQSEKELESVAEEMGQLEEVIKEQAVARDESKAQLKEVENYLETKKDEAATMKEELDEKETELNQIRAAEIEMRNRLEEQTKSLVDNQKKHAYWVEKLNKLTLHSLDDLVTSKPAKPPKAKKPEREEGDGEENEEEESEEEEEEEEEKEGQPSLTEYSEDELLEMDKDSLKTEIALIEERIQNVSVDLAVLQEYRRRVEEHAARKQDLDEAVANRDSVKQRCDELRKRRLSEFQEGFNQISLRLKEMYQMITMGGNAELEFVDSLDPFSEGINFSVMPPKKSWKNISNLSGGEKTLSSLALVFALHHYKPTPLYVMDEIDAALDFRNVSIVASYIKERTRNAQFIVISLRNNMFELAARLIGVYKVNHMTKSVAINNDDYIVRK